MTSYEPVDLYETINVINYLPELFKDMQYLKNIYNRNYVEFPLTKWHRVHDKVYILIRVLVDLDNYENYILRIVEGSMRNNLNIIFESDHCIDIKNDTTSVKNAIKDITNNTIPFISNTIIDYKRYSYLIRD